MAASPSGSPSRVITKLECIRCRNWCKALNALCGLLVSCSGFRSMLSLHDDKKTLSCRKDKNRRIACRHEPLPCRSEVTCQNVAFTNSIISEKPIGGLGVSPVLARHGVDEPTRLDNCSSSCRSRLPCRASGKNASHQLIVYPRIPSRRICRWPLLNASRQPFGFHGSYCAMDFFSV